MLSVKYTVDGEIAIMIGNPGYRGEKSVEIRAAENEPRVITFLQIFNYLPRECRIIGTYGNKNGAKISLKVFLLAACKTPGHFTRADALCMSPYIFSINSDGQRQLTIEPGCSLFFTEEEHHNEFMRTN